MIDNDVMLCFAAISTSNVQDVRDVLNYYRQFDNPLEMFKENRRKLLVSKSCNGMRNVEKDCSNRLNLYHRQMQMEEEQSKAQQESSKVLTSKWKSSFLRNR